MSTNDPIASDLRARFGASPITVCVMGLGYVGLPLAHAFHRGGGSGARAGANATIAGSTPCNVIGFDTDPAKPAAFASRPPRAYLKHLGQDVYDELASSGRFMPTTDESRLADADAILVCVPTPLDERHEPDLSYVVGSARAIARHLRRGQLIVLESTTYPGTTRNEFLAPLLAAHPTWQHGVDYFVAFSPEREDPGNKLHPTSTIPKVVGGLDELSGHAACALYSRAFQTVVPVRSAEIAESSKILENTFRAVNIALVNELKVVFSAMGVDIWEVIGAAKTKPFGFMPFYPGPGLGGHCIPIDPFYLAWLARKIGTPSEFIELAGRINTTMPSRVVGIAIEALRDHGRAVAGSRVLIMGLAYKPDIDDVRESPSFELIERLRDLGASVDYTDPHVSATHPGRKYDLEMTSVALTPETLGSYDCVIIATHHALFDFAMVAKHAKLVVDTRNAMAAFAAEMGARLVKA